MAQQDCLKKWEHAVRRHVFLEFSSEGHDTALVCIKAY